MDNYLLALLQLGDSNFPSGAFSHSFGLETYIQEGKVDDQESFFHWMRIYLEKQLVFTDGLAFRLTLENIGIDHICTLDLKLFALNVPEETRQANRRIGERLIKMGMDLYSIPLLDEYYVKIRSSLAHGHPAIAFAVICDFFKIDRKQALITYLYSTIVSLVQNGVRGIPLGQTAGQRILLTLQPHLLEAVKKIETLDSEDLGATVPGIEIAQMRHERLNVRLFMS